MAKTLGEDFSSQWKELSESRLYFSKTEIESLGSGLNKCRTVLYRVRRSLHKYPNVVGTGVSLKFKKGQLLQQPCIVVRVSKKIPNLKEGALPSEISGCPLDVIETGVMRPQAHWPEPVCRLLPGNSISHRNGGMGTIGCLVRERLLVDRWKELYRTKPQSDILILSCNHVIANFNAAIDGDKLFHPGLSVSDDSQCATLLRREPLKSFPAVNEIDAAIAKPLIPVNPNRQGFGVPEALGDVKDVLEKVFLTGATSGHTEEIVVDKDARVSCPQFGPLRGVDFVHSIVTPKMSDPGDSGSVIVKEDPNVGGSKLVAVGLLYGGNEFKKVPPDNLPQSYFCPLRRVLDILNVDLVVNTQSPFIKWDDIFE